MDAPAHWLEPETYLEAIERETRRFRECLAGSEPGTRVPGCPDWDVDDLLWHLGGEVQAFWAWTITHRPEVPRDWPEPARPDGRTAILRCLDRAHGELMLRLRNADPREGAWSWVGDPRLHTVGFTLRRQAHEALIHRVDAELAVGDRTPLDPVLAADGVVECLEWMYGDLPGWARYEPDGSHVLVELTDVGRRVLLGLGWVTGCDPEDGEDVDRAHLSVVAHTRGEGRAAATVSGTAEQLDLWLWHRGPAHPLDLDGDEAVLERLATVLGQPID